MSSRIITAQIEEQYRRSIELREKEQQKYGELLTALDQISHLDLPHELPSRYSELKEALNRAWDIGPEALSAASAENRVFWNEVARATAEYLKPFVAQQREFNSLVVHFLNEFTTALHQTLEQIRQFEHTQILFFQRLIPLIDAKFREIVAYEHVFLVRLRDYTDLMFEEMDQKIVGIQSDVEGLPALQTSIRSLQHFANTWRAETMEAIHSSQHIEQNLHNGSSNEQAQYFHFQEDLRGKREEVKDKFRQYVQHFQSASAGLVIDLGCGRGEFLELMKEANIAAAGVDSNEQMVEQCRQLGLQVTCGDLLDFLRDQAENSLAGIFCSQVVEHLTPDYLQNFLAVGYSRLVPGGTILIETVNIASAFAFLHVYTKDLSHRTPLHPDTLQFMMSAAGFQNPTLIYNSPILAIDKMGLHQNATDQHQALFNENMIKLNRLLFDDQEYAVIARK